MATKYADYEVMATTEGKFHWSADFDKQICCFFFVATGFISRSTSNTCGAV